MECISLAPLLSQGNTLASIADGCIQIIPFALHHAQGSIRIRQDRHSSVNQASLIRQAQDLLA